MLGLGQVKAGTRIIFRGAPHIVTEANHLKVGRGGAKLVCKLKNLLSGATIENTFQGDERIEEADISYRPASFLYKENSQAVCMDMSSYEQFKAPLTGNQGDFLKDDQPIDVVLWDNQAIELRLPKKVELKVIYTEPGFKGDSVSATLKPATLETEAVINVPLFVKTGDTIRVNTETGGYDSRA